LVTLKSYFCMLKLRIDNDQEEQELKAEDHPARYWGGSPARHREESVEAPQTGCGWSAPTEFANYWVLTWLN
jgi:hypothetical protein